MSHSFLYNDFSTFLRTNFDHKVQKISINAGFTCPNRDGTKGVGGCTYCNNQTFNPEYCNNHKSVRQQLEEGKEFFSRKYPEMKYLAYFQAYTNTYGDIHHLKNLYEEALHVDDVVGIVIGTRPDCVSDLLLEYLEELNKEIFLIVEYGIESVYDRTLERINRGHTYLETVDAIKKTASRNIVTGGHVILGLPGESQEDIINQASCLSALPLNTLKLHQLQLIKGTKMAKDYEQNPQEYHLYEVDEYIDLVIDFVERLSPDIILERFASQSPKELLIAPDWGIKNYEFTERLKKRMKQRGSYQGRLYRN